MAQSNQCQSLQNTEVAFRKRRNKQEIPVTTVVRHLHEKKINFIPHFYNYEDHSGTKVASIALNIPERNVIKTILLETDKKQPLIVLMHGDCEFSTKNLACLLGVKHVGPCDLKTAEKHTGYIFGGTSPFGTRKQLPVYINGDKHCISDYKS